MWKTQALRTAQMSLILTQIHHAQMQKAQATVMKRQLTGMLQTAGLLQLQPTELQ